MTLPTGPSTPKSFWSKPDGKTQLFIFGAVGVAVFWFWGTIAPFVLSTVQTTAQIAMWCGALFVAGVVLTNKQFRTGMWFLYQTFLRKLTGLIIEMDPIAILKTYIRSLQDQLEEMDQRRTDLEGARTKLQMKIQSNADQSNKEIQLGLKAREKGMEDQAVLHGMRGAGLQEMNTKLMPLLTKMTQLKEFLDKAYKAADFTIKQADIQVELKEAEYEAVKTSSKALRSAMAIFKGNPDKRQMFEQSLEFIQDDMARKLGEMKHIVDFSKNFIDAADLEDSVRYDEAMKMLDGYAANKQQSLAVLSDQTIIGNTLPASQKVKVLNAPSTTVGNDW